MKQKDKVTIENIQLILHLIVFITLMIFVPITPLNFFLNVISAISGLASVTYIILYWASRDTAKIPYEKSGILANSLKKDINALVEKEKVLIEKKQKRELALFDYQFNFRDFSIYADSHKKRETQKIISNLKKEINSINENSEEIKREMDIALCIFISKME